MKKSIKELLKSVRLAVLIIISLIIAPMAFPLCNLAESNKAGKVIKAIATVFAYPMAWLVIYYCKDYVWPRFKKLGKKN